MESKLPRAVLFDAYGTLFDVYSVGALAESMYPGRGEQLSLLWRDKHIEYARLVSMSDRWRPFGELMAASLRFSCARLDLALDADAERRFIEQYRRLPAFPEVREVLLGLRERGVHAGILSNGDPPMLAEVVEHAGLQGLLDPLISVEPVRRFKTDPACYALGTSALGLAASDVLFVSSNGWDAIGATWFGYTTLWINRAGLPLDQLDTPPTRTGSSLRDAMSFFPS